MIFKIAVVVICQVLYVQADCTFDACAFQSCPADVYSECCANAVKAMCNQSHLDYGFDPVFVKSFEHSIGKGRNDVLSNIHVHGIRKGVYTNQICTANGFKLDIYYEKLDIYAAVNKGRSSGAYEGHVSELRAPATLTLSYSADSPVPIVTVDVGDYSIGEYSFQLSNEIKRNSKKADGFILSLLHKIYVDVFTKLFTDNQCPQK